MTAKQLRNEIEKFRKLQDELAEFGAYDSEPNYHFFQALVNTIRGKKAEIPNTARGWELYTTVRGSGQAAKKMAIAAKKVVAAMDTSPTIEARAAVEYYIGRF